jgi:hydrogenase expression/formation protein HypE
MAITNTDDAPKFVTLSHGAGGRLSRRLVADLARIFDNPLLAPLADAAVFDAPEGRLAFTTDSHVISPLFFPGGDIGRLAIFGTVNDLAVMGARPLYLACGLIIEEGLAFDILERVARSLARAAEQAEVQIITGDSKVVERGKGDGLFINTTGIGLIQAGSDLSRDAIRPGDGVILTGTLGDHAIAVLNEREGLRFGQEPQSDCAPLWGMLSVLLQRCRGVKWMRDPTRGGLSAALNELVEGRDFGIELQEDAIPMKPAVRSVCELLGFDPLHLANEGKAVIVIDGSEIEAALELLRRRTLGQDAAVIGSVVEKPQGRVVMKTLIGGMRVVDMPAGELLPRIC